MHAAVTKGVTNSQKILIAVTNMKGAASEWFFMTNDRHAELYGGQPLFNSFQRFKELFLQRFGQMNTANAMEKLETVKLKKGETVATFAQALENLFYSANLVDEQAKLYYFFRAIEDPLKSQVRGCKPLTLNQAIQDAIHFDQRMSIEEQKQSRFFESKTQSTKSKRDHDTSLVADTNEIDYPGETQERTTQRLINNPSAQNEAEWNEEKTPYPEGERAIARITAEIEEEENLLLDTPDDEPSFQAMWKKNVRLECFLES